MTLHPRRLHSIAALGLALLWMGPAAPSLRAQTGNDPTFEEDTAGEVHPLQQEARALYHRVVKIYKQKKQIESPDAQWWYELAKACGLLAYRDPTSLTQALAKFEQLLKQKPDVEEAKDGLRLAELTLKFKN
ncbi:exported hypothetical protein [Nitrospina gracilis 3/211]|uniref:Uncharacterized protein n=1 Tax=Nitrospina gracilis (strain 3/211) TaxID=1266370 RepID=M1Z070_NITG3|nr:MULTISPECIES: hypothetical protein [Nitrospina]MCF8724000.1 hypothetical protein [Nitrospina sp. Nb-3]CCQ91125.1 exported hypothetical protein [Nitrospina gracilis 3/211]